MRRPTKAAASSRSNGNSNFTTFSTDRTYDNNDGNTLSTSSHLDLSSANDDHHGTTTDNNAKKIHKKSKLQIISRKRSSLISIVCGFVIALGTIFYAVREFTHIFAKGNNKSSSLVHRNSHHHNLQLPPDSIYRAKVTDIHNTPQDLLQYAGSISLIVNVACE